MRHFGGLFWFILVMATGIGNFAVKHTVQGLDDELNAVRKKTIAEQKEIHELTADWTFLNQPELLANLNNRYVHLGPVSPKQVESSIDNLPLRPAAPPAAPEPQIAAAVPPVLVAQQAPPPAPLPIVRAAAVSAPAPRPSPIVQVAASVPARPKPTASLDSIFAQVSGGR